MSVLVVDPSGFMLFIQNKKRHLADCGFKIPTSALLALAQLNCLQVTNPDTSGCHSKGERQTTSNLFFYYVMLHRHCLLAFKPLLLLHSTDFLYSLPVVLSVS